MSRYIDIEPVIAATKSMKFHFEAIRIDGIIDRLEEAPTADVVEVMHGEWIDLDFGTVECSVCGLQQVEFFDCENQCWDKFCKKCGAKMDLGCDT